MSYTYDDIKGKTVAQLREIAKGIEHEAVKGYTQLNKERLIAAVCTALSIDVHAARKVTSAEKGGIKESIRAAKRERDEAISKKDRSAMRQAQRKIRDYKRQMRKMAKIKV